MAGTVTITYQEHAPVRACTVAWTSDSSGDANGTATKAIYGTILRTVTNSGAAAPTTLYDIVINDADGVDVLAGGLANRSATVTEQVISDPPVAFAGTLEVQVSNAGDTKNGTVVIYYR